MMKKIQTHFDIDIETTGTGIETRRKQIRARMMKIMRMIDRIFIGYCLLSLPLTAAFAPPTITRRLSSTTTTSQRHLDASELSAEQVAARTDFFIWLFGASGAAGVARSAFPRMYNNIREIQSYRNVYGGNGANSGNNAGSNGDKVGISPLCGYPRDLAVKDIQAIVQNKLSIDQIVSKYPVENNLWAKKGYITYAAFRQANAKVDPLAVRAVFDCFSQSTEVSNPEIAQAKLEKYKESLDSFKNDLLYSKVVGWAAIVTLLGLLGLADIEAYGYAYTGWFPDWPGGRLWLQGGLLDPETGLLAIPKYWI